MRFSCVDSGLWVPEGGKAKEFTEEGGKSGDKKDNEEVYSSVAETAPTKEKDDSTPV